MNILKSFRKQYISIFLTTIILFVSCSPNNVHENNEVYKQNENLVLQDYVEKQLKLTLELTDLVSNDRHAILKALENMEDITDIDDIYIALQKSDIKNANSIAILMKNLHQNTFEFFEKNPEIQKLGMKEIKRLVFNEINIQKLSILKNGQRGPCENQYAAAKEVCNDNYTYSLVVVGISAFFSFGIGTAIGTVGATIALANCIDNAFHAYDGCLENHQ